MKQVLTELANFTWPTPQRSAFGRTWPPFTTWLSVAHLVEATEQDRKTVLQNLKRLEERRLIARIGTDGRTNQVNVYQLAVANLETGAEHATGVQNDTGAGNNTGAASKGSTELPTGTEIGAIPNAPLTGVAFPAEQSQFRTAPGPKTGHGTVLIGIEMKEGECCAQVRSVDPQAARLRAAKPSRPESFRERDERLAAETIARWGGAAIAAKVGRVVDSKVIELNEESSDEVGATRYR